MNAAPHVPRSLSRLRAWLTLFRVPNLFTLPGEPLAGAVLAAQGAVFTSAVAWTLVAVAAFYLGGLVWNDYYDRGRDRHTRPQRPIPSGLISPRAAFYAGHLLQLAGLMICAHLGVLSLLLGVGLACAAFVYNRGLKRVPFFGELSMGLCRGLSVLLGATAVSPHGPLSTEVLTLSAIITGYIVVVTYLAKREARAIHPGIESSLPLLFLLLAGGIHATLFPGHPEAGAYAIYAYGVALLISAAFAARMWLLRSTPNLPLALRRKQLFKQVMPVWVGRLLGVLLFLHLGVILSIMPGAEAMPYVFALCSCWLLQRLLARWFYAS